MKKILRNFLKIFWEIFLKCFNYFQFLFEIVLREFFEKNFKRFFGKYILRDFWKIFERFFCGSFKRFVVDLLRDLTFIYHPWCSLDFIGAKFVLF